MTLDVRLVIPLITANNATKAFTCPEAVATNATMVDVRFAAIAANYCKQRKYGFYLSESSCYKCNNSEYAVFSSANYCT